MHVLFAGQPDNPLVPFLRSECGLLTTTDSPLTVEYLQELGIDFLVSYGFRHLIRADVLELLSGRVVNLHISYLPFNRGADPNFWSFVEQTPKGVTIHQVDIGLDTGPVLLQSQVELATELSLRETYAELQRQIQQLFVQNWSTLAEHQITPRRQLQGQGTYHRSVDKQKLVEAIGSDWLDQPIQQWLPRIQEIHRRDRR